MPDNKASNRRGGQVGHHVQRGLHLQGGPGVPCGTRCAIILLYWWIMAQTILPTHIGRARVRVKDMWLDLVNTKGQRPIVLENKISEDPVL